MGQAAYSKYILGSSEYDMNISFVNHLCWDKYQFAVTAVTPAKPRG